MECRQLPGMPRERLMEAGAQALSDADLIAVLVAPGSRRLPGEAMARRLLAECGPVRRLATRRAGELAGIPGVGSARACRIVAALELGRRAAEQHEPGALVGGAADVHLRWARLTTEPEETFVAIGVNSRNRVVGEWVVARGWESGVNLTPRQVFTLLVKEAVTRVIFVHNHPSGDPGPSAEDLRFTRRLIDAAKCLDIRVLDHVIVASGGHVSLRLHGAPDLEFA
ncbi:MAG: DNA repair protein RadC [Deltaproteobacteria bacterium]|nr:DNA repair protein RadC [Deltaproteobacteria bacterium]